MVNSDTEVSSATRIQRTPGLDIGFDPRVPGLPGDSAGLIEVVTEGERMGFDYVTFSDHLVSPQGIESVYPYSDDGKWPTIATGARHDLLTALAFLSARTTTLRFVTAVMVVPYRPAVLTAKVLATIDVMSGGRLTVGVGTGWMKDEFEATNSPDFAARGKVTDEYLQAMKILWTESAPEFDGEYASFKNILFEPKPMQRPHPPLWVGGISRPAMRRVVRFGDAWYPVLTDQKQPLDSLELMAAGIDGMHAAVEAAGRDPESITVAVRVHSHGADAPLIAADGNRRMLSGTAEQVAEDIVALEALGVTSVDMRFTSDSTNGVLDAMEQFQQDVVPLVR